MRFNKNLKKINFSYKKDFSKIHLTLDTKEDLKIIKKVYDNFYPDIYFGIDNVIKLFKEKPTLFQKNVKRKKNLVSKGEKLWKKAKN